MRQIRNFLTCFAIVIISGLFLVPGFSLEAQQQPEERTNPIKISVESIRRGEAVFAGYCSGCHGQRADGKGRQAMNLIPKPQNLTNAPFVKYLSDERIFSSVSGGVRGTSMPAFEFQLSKNQRWDVINYIRSIASALSPDIPNTPKPVKVVFNVKNPIAISEASLAAGSRLFTKYCTSCHGNQADGKGKTAENLVPKPRNLVTITSWGEVPFIDYITDNRLYDSIANGVAGTSMSPWGPVLKEEGIWNVINYLRAEAKKKKTDYKQSYSDK